MLGFEDILYSVINYYARIRGHNRYCYISICSDSRTYEKLWNYLYVYKYLWYMCVIIYRWDMDVYVIFRCETVYTCLWYMCVIIYHWDMAVYVISHCESAYTCLWYMCDHISLRHCCLRYFHWYKPMSSPTLCWRLLACIIRKLRYFWSMLGLESHMHTLRNGACCLVNLWCIRSSWVYLLSM